MMILKIATISLLLSSGAAFAQVQPQPSTSGPPGFPTTTTGASATGGVKVEQSALPTPAQCTAGYQQGMSW